MTLTTRIRFTEPIDPRTIWERVKVLVQAPKRYEYAHNAAGSRPFHNGDVWPLNPEIRAVPDQGARALAWLEYGAEGSLLVDDPDDENPAPPKAYVELALDSPYGYQDDQGHTCDTLHAAFVATLRAWSPVPVVWQDEYTGEWHS